MAAIRKRVFVKVRSPKYADNPENTMSDNSLSEFHRVDAVDAPLFEAITRLDTLEVAWEKVRANAGGAGGDRMTVEEFSIDLPTRLVRLQLALRHGTYRPGPLRRVDVPKDSGGVRVLSIPTVADRVAQTAAALVLGPTLDAEMEDSSFGYRPGRSVAMAVAHVAELRRAGYEWVVDGDIERYFDRVPHDRLLARLERSVAERPVLDLVALWLDAFSGPEGRWGLGLPQGSPIAPLLANLYLDDVDERIAGRGVRLVRFADDFLLMCRTETAAESARGRMAELLAEHGLRLNPDKTRVVPFERGFRFLGHLFVRSLVVKEIDTGEEPVRDGLLPDAARLLAAHPPDGAEAPDDDDPGARAPGLRVLYVTEPGRRLGLRNQSFTVTEDGAELIAIPPQRLDRVELGPGSDAAPQALRHALAHGVRVAFVDGGGDTLGTLEPAVAPRAGLHLAQARCALDPAVRLDLARRIVAGRLANQRALLARLNRRRKDDAVADAVRALTATLRRLPLAEDVPALMGHEGAGAALYWPALGRCLEHGWRFERRLRRPPPDPVNLVFFFLATMLHRDVAALAARHGLHPGFGVLHSARNGAEACVSDLMEEFRAPLAEGLAVYLFNNRVLRPDGFARDGSGQGGAAGEGGRVRILPEARRAVIRGWEAWLDRPVKGADGVRRLWRRQIEAQVVAYARAVQGEAPYEPYRMDY